MAEPQEGEHQDNAILQLMVEFRQVWRADEAVTSSPAPPAPVPAKRVSSWAGILLLAAAVTCVYLVDQLWARSGGTGIQFPWAPRGQTAARPAANHAPQPVSLPTATDQDAGASNPSPSTVLPESAQPAVHVAPSAPETSADGTGQLAGYHVQVGAFNVREYAQDLMHQLRAHDYPATLVDAPTGPPHRVWIEGAFDRLSAERLVARLRNDGFEAILLRQ
jgi:cell division septation protein DedD